MHIYTGAITIRAGLKHKHKRLHADSSLANFPKISQVRVTQCIYQMHSNDKNLEHS